MRQEISDFARTYSGMADEELVELSAESASLVDAAGKALQDELQRRGLKPQGPVKITTASYCSHCERHITDPLTCGSCSARICRVCGTPLEVEWDVEDKSGGDGSGEMQTGQVAG